jgi:hypothetical protein
MTPTNFTSNIVDEYGKTELRVTYAAGVAEGSIIKEFPRKHKLLPVNDADRRGVTDPLSAVLIRANTRDGVLESANCNRVLLIFDGQRRYNLMLAYVRLDKINIERSYSGPVLVCGHQISQGYGLWYERRLGTIRFGPQFDPLYSAGIQCAFFIVYWLGGVGSHA